MAKPRKARQGPELPAEYKLAAVQERLRGTREEDVAKAFGVKPATIYKWVKRFRDKGVDGLQSGRAAENASRKKDTPAKAVKREKVVALKREHETWGTRRISDVLARFEALGVSEQQVRAILHDEGLIEPAAAIKEREHAPRRFERATPNQLWQSDIFTFRLRRAERLYVCVFMDDHSRFVVGHSLAHHQKSALVMEAFERGIAAYGQPTEVLTDNGRQYTVWRGKTEFEELLARMGVHHIRSRPQHPQTLGKVERFWKTLWDEFLGRTVFAHVVDAQRRLEHFISHYNLQRPHQALDGLVPADRFFKAAAHVRTEIERAVAQNELRLALEQPPRKPFYVVGQLGDQHLSIAAGATGLQVHLGGKSETIPLQENDDAPSTSRQFATQAQEPSNATMAGDDEIGSRCGGAEPRAAGAVGALGGEAGDERDRGRWDLSRLLLSARDQGAQRNAAGAGAGGGRGREPGRDRTAPPDQTAGREADAGRSGSAASRTNAAGATQAVRPWASEDPSWSAAEGDDDNTIDAGWAQKLALLDDDEEAARNDTIDQAAGFVPFDPDAGWRERGPERWERKLAGADAVSENVIDGQHQATDLHTSAGPADRSRAAAPLRRDPGSADTDADGEWSRTLAGPVAEPLPDDLPSSAGVDDRGDDAEAGGQTGEACAGSGAGGGEREAEGGERSAADEDGSDRAGDDRGGWDRFWEDAFDAISAEITKQEDEVRGPGTSTDPTGGGDDDA
jgi:transposase InsO family protein